LRGRSRQADHGHPSTVGEALTREQPLLRGLPAERAQTSEPASPRVDAKAMVTVRQNRYSVPVALVGLRVHAEIGAREIALSTTAGSSLVMTGSLGRFGVSAQLDHYLDLLVHKPGALAGSVVAAPAAPAGRGPAASTSCGRKLHRAYGTL